MTAEYKLEVWSDSDPEYGSLAVPPRLVWFWRVIGKTGDYGSVVEECDHGYPTKEEAEVEGNGRLFQLLNPLQAKIDKLRNVLFQLQRNLQFAITSGAEFNLKKALVLVDWAINETLE